MTNHLHPPVGKITRFWVIFAIFPWVIILSIIEWKWPWTIVYNIWKMFDQVDLSYDDCELDSDKQMESSWRHDL